MKYKRIGIAQMSEEFPTPRNVMNKQNTPHCFPFLIIFTSLVSILLTLLKTYLRGHQNFSIGKFHGLVSHVNVMDSSASFNICNHLLLIEMFSLNYYPALFEFFHTYDLYKSIGHHWLSLKRLVINESPIYCVFSAVRIWWPRLNGKGTEAK